MLTFICVGVNSDICITGIKNCGFALFQTVPQVTSHPVRKYIVLPQQKFEKSRAKQKEQYRYCSFLMLFVCKKLQQTAAAGINITVCGFKITCVPGVCHIAVTARKLHQFEYFLLWVAGNNSFDISHIV